MGDEESQKRFIDLVHPSSESSWKGSERWITNCTDREGSRCVCPVCVDDQGVVEHYSKRYRHYKLMIPTILIIKHHRSADICKLEDKIVWNYIQTYPKYRSIERHTQYTSRSSICSALSKTIRSGSMVVLEKLCVKGRIKQRVFHTF